MKDLTDFTRGQHRINAILMKLLKDIKQKNMGYTRGQMLKDLSKHHNLILATANDLKVGLNYIRIVQWQLLSEVKKHNFKKMVLRNMLLQGETKQEYIQYKDVIKQFTKNKEIYIWINK